ncbi:MAG: hypothetical protein KY459_11190 [Acidobacteria bacterium]|nr:hypothetical protein [Acidobacteriota bacterium]
MKEQKPSDRKQNDPKRNEKEREGFEGAPKKGTDKNPNPTQKTGNRPQNR